MILIKNFEKSSPYPTNHDFDKKKNTFDKSWSCRDTEISILFGRKFCLLPSLYPSLFFFPSPINLLFLSFHHDIFHHSFIYQGICWSFILDIFLKNLDIFALKGITQTSHQMTTVKQLSALRRNTREWRWTLVFLRRVENGISNRFCYQSAGYRTTQSNLTAWAKWKKKTWKMTGFTWY